MVDAVNIIVILIAVLAFLFFITDFLTLPEPASMDKIFFGGLFLVPFNNFIVFRFGSVDTRFLHLFWGLPLFFLLFKIKKLYSRNKALVVRLFFFILINFFSIVVSSNVGLTIKESVQYLYFGLVFLYAINVLQNKENIFVFVKVLIFSSIFFSLYGLIEFGYGERLATQYVIDIFEGKIFRYFDGLINQDTLSGINIVRAESMNWGAVGTAQILLIFFFISLGYFDYLQNIGDQNFHKYLSFISLSLTAMLLLLTYSRAGYLVLLLLVIFYVRYLNSANKKLIFIGIGLTLFVLVINKLFISRIGEIGTASEGSNAIHYMLYLAAIDMFLTHPIMGVGSGNFAAIAPSYSDNTLYPFAVATDTHNFILQILAELGIAGFVSILLLLLVVINPIYFFINKKNRDETTVLRMSFLLACLSSVMMSLTMNGFKIEISWLIMASAFLSVNIYKLKSTYVKN